MLKIQLREPTVQIVYLGILLTITIGWIPTAFGTRVGEYLFDILIITASIAALIKCGLRNNSLLKFLVFWLLYIGVGLFLAVYLRKVHILDFLLAYKFIFYMILLIPLAWSRTPIEKHDLKRLLYVSIFMFFTVYAVKRFLINDDRPELMDENNYEMIFLALLFYACHISGATLSSITKPMLFAIAALSGSRSAAAVVAVVVLFTIDFNAKNYIRTIAGLLFAAAGTLVALLVFESRTQHGLDETDRFRFMELFIESISNWNWWNYFLGSPRLTEIPSHICSQLSYYQKLFSKADTGACYSVIFHSFNLRIFHDHGIIIVAVTLIFLANVLKDLSPLKRAGVLMIVLLSGLSVSALNNSYMILGIIVICLAAATKGRKSSPPQKSLGAFFNESKRRTLIATQEVPPINSCND